MKLDRKLLKSLILETIEESQYYYDAQDLDTDYGYQAIELGQQMGDEEDRDRAAQVDKYVSLKVTKALKDAMEITTMSNLEGLQNEAASHIGLRYIAKDFDEYDQRTYDGLGEMYKKAFKRPLEALEQFDGTQESFDKWYEALKSVERVLMKARDPGMHYWGRLTPETLTISDYFITGREDDWGDVYERWDVKPETAVEEAEDFFRPAIMKSIMGIQSRKSGMDVGGMMGLTEDEDENKPLYYEMMLDFDNPEIILHGIYLLAASELGIFTKGDEHEFVGTDHDPFSVDGQDDYHGQDEYVFKVDSKEDALKLQEALRDFYEPIKREIYIGADWYGGPPRVMMDIPK